MTPARQSAGRLPDLALTARLVRMRSTLQRLACWSQMTPACQSAGRLPDLALTVRRVRMHPTLCLACCSQRNWARQSAERLVRWS